MSGEEAKQRREDWKMAVRIEKILCAVLHRGAQVAGGEDYGDSRKEP
jgi:hypothetical protein